MPTAVDLHYPQSCPFCAIANAYQSTPSDSLSSYIPSSPDPARVSPECHLILCTPTVLAFLDIQPMTRGHVLVISRRHAEKLGDLKDGEGGALGSWLPVLSRAVCKVTGVGDWNTVQNNGIRAAQVVPHVHFHIIPRPETVPSLQARSWTMFGKGQREELDDDEGAKLAGEMREVLRMELGRAGEEEEEAAAGKAKL
ncbi:hypothetical protein B0A49_04687 [Cryomyces minteri]|uniref:HIT domain-containing protein n=1 Tax=Cryomyces minteri TaxID=331657 RepID=A0A4U0XEU4_9PEZI|nr:hypothetical protein B0A49_04687 [Cryomyces minteri]